MQNRQMIGKWALLALGTALALGLAESAVRFGLVHDPIGEYERIDGETSAPARRVLLLGDSFVDKRGGTFHAELVDRLAADRYAIVNLAVSGTGPAHYRDVLAKYGPAFRPDEVVLFYFAGNDLINVIRYEPARPGVGWTARLRDWIRPFVHRSHLYHAVTTRPGAPEFDFDVMLADGVDPDLVARARTGEVNPWLLLIPRDVRARYLATNLLIESEESRAGVTALRDILHEIAAMTEEIGATLEIVVFPATTQVSDSHFDFYRRAGFDPDPRTLDEDAPQRMIAGLADEIGAPTLDLLPIFRAHAGPDLYKPYDSHLNEIGNALSADHVARFLLSRRATDEESGDAGPAEDAGGRRLDPDADGADSP